MKQTIPRRTSGDSAPLSFAQQRLWFLNQLEPANPVYNVYRAWRLSGRLNVEALRRALDTVVARHQVLRSTFKVVDGQPVQVTAENLSIPLEIIDLKSLSLEEREAKSERITSREARLPFDLEKGPLLRVKLLRLAEEEHILVLTMHHIATDGWSMGVLHREMASLYDAFIAGKPSPLPDLPIQYSDYALWQREWLQGDVLEKQLSYWKRQLAGLPVLELPTDRPRPPIQSHQGAREVFRLTPALTAQLKAFSQRERVTLFMTLLASVKVLLHRYSRQDDVVVGTLIANRIRTELEPLIGMLVNTLTLRTDLGGDPSFRKLLGRVRDVALAAYGHQDLPFEKLVEELQAERDMSRNPLFQVAFTLQNTPDQALGLSGINTTPFTAGSVSPFNAGNDTAKFDLTVSMVETDDGVAGSLEYSTDLFDRTTIRRMAGHLQTLLEGIAANPDQRLSELPILTGAEKQQLLLEWNDTKRDYPKGKCIHELFEEQVKRSPDAVAVAFEDQRLTYRELNRRANQLAHYLQTLGVEVGPEVPVGICMERSLEMVVGILGILKAGGAYVPLDPSYPKERLGFMLDDSRPLVVLTQQTLLSQLPETIRHAQSERRHAPCAMRRPIVICLDTDWNIIARESEENPAGEVRAHNLAYVIYTSGSTGRPKGAMVEHRSLVNYLSWVNENLLQDTVNNLPVVTKLSFDASLKQLFPPLMRGGEVWILSDEIISQPTALLGELDSRSEVGFNCVPSFWSPILEFLCSEQGSALGRNLQCLFVGGEQLTKGLANRTFQAIPHLKIWNLYGPTEATANASATKITSDGGVTIGRPIANTQLYILDSHLQPVPVGVSGELHIGGDGLARGYLNRPGLTAEKFIPNPFSPVLSPLTSLTIDSVEGDGRGARLYKTGDLARYLPDGNIEFFGRIDNQVKIRGFRIELGEIEAVLGQSPAVEQAVVLAREDTPGETRLVAYVISKQKPSPSVSELRGFLKEKLPDHMVPSAFVFLDVLPLTPNGKVDRKALPEPDQTRPELEQTFAAPRTDTEKMLAGIWCEVLKLEQVGVHDDFFELGGHSLLATQVVSRIRDALQAELPLYALFENPTVAELAIRISRTQSSETVPEELADVLDNVQLLSDEEAERLLAGKGSKEI